MLTEVEECSKKTKPTKKAIAMYTNDPAREFANKTNLMSIKFHFIDTKCVYNKMQSWY